MSSNNDFSTAGQGKQAEIIQKLMVLFKGNDRFHGAADVIGAKYDEDKNKWRPGNIRAIHKGLSEEDWRAHLLGEYFIGISPLQDDGTVWFTCMDVDKAGEINYDFDYPDEMGKIKRSGFPLVVHRTKSGGLRVTIFFSEPVEAELAIKRMQQMAAQLGYAGCEIFPKQYKVNDPSKDCPAWIFLPYGPTREDRFSDQCCMNESGHAMELYESVVYAMKRRITRQQFFDLFVVEMKARANGKANGKHRVQGIWTEEKDHATTVDTTFHDGPMCLWIIARQNCIQYQHNFLLTCATFFMRKYTDNWEMALKWVNDHVLVPPGDHDKLQQMRESLKKRDKDRPYEYQCKTEPICSHCFAKACRKQPYGVGIGNGIDYYDLGLTVYNSKPQIFFTNVGEERIACNADELLNLNKYRIKCLEYSMSFPDNMPKKDWERIVKNSLENATQVDPPDIMKTDAKELRILEDWLSIHIMSGVRRNYGEFMIGEWGDSVRIRESEKRIYFKAKKLFTAVRLRRGPAEEQIITEYVGHKCMEHKQGPGARAWFRYTYSIGFDQFNEETLQHWFDPDRPERKDE
jgi:hypothetical protein